MFVKMLWSFVNCVLYQIGLLEEHQVVTRNCQLCHTCPSSVQITKIPACVAIWRTAQSADRAFHNDNGRSLFFPPPMNYASCTSLHLKHTPTTPSWPAHCAIARAFNPFWVEGRIQIATTNERGWNRTCPKVDDAQSKDRTLQ